MLLTKLKGSKFFKINSNRFSSKSYSVCYLFFDRENLGAHFNRTETEVVKQEIRAQELFLIGTSIKHVPLSLQLSYHFVTKRIY